MPTSSPAPWQSYTPYSGQSSFIKRGRHYATKGSKTDEGHSKHHSITTVTYLKRWESDMREDKGRKKAFR